ncbi:hypothetical protein MPLSOD_130019 [Mesorhizobium sp. SOD10]|nr:hypothetical protein MPLSOD_130019 [Mesorhizobium sp. SOD10]
MTGGSSQPEANLARRQAGILYDKRNENCVKRPVSRAALGAWSVRLQLTGYALVAMVHCNIFLLQCTTPMSCSQSSGRKN